MILQKTEKINSKSQILAKLNEANVIGFVCPCCKGKEFVYYGSYKRYLRIKENNEITEFEVKIKRVKCKTCNRTHAVIPDFIIPYKLCTVKLVNKVIYLKINNIKTNKEIEEEYEVSRQLLNKWIKEFKRIESKVILLINNKKRLLKLITNEYYENYKEIYLMKRLIFYGYAST